MSQPNKRMSNPRAPKPKPISWATPRLRAALRCVRALRRTLARPRILTTTVDRYDGHYTFPDSDAQARCAGCGMYSKNPTAEHEPGCLVVEAHRALLAFDTAPARRRS